MQDTTSQVTKELIRTREALTDPNNWCQYRASNGQGGRCLLGALFNYDVTRSRYSVDPGNATHSQYKAYKLLDRMLWERGCCVGVPTWNDAHAAHEDVLQLLDEAIVLSTQKDMANAGYSYREADQRVASQEAAEEAPGATWPGVAGNPFGEPGGPLGPQETPVQTERADNCLEPVG